MRGDDSLVSSISIWARGEGFWGIGRRHPLRERWSGRQYGTGTGGEKTGLPAFRRQPAEPEVETRHYLRAYFGNVRCPTERYPDFA
jgi:hypothetical protein